ncbi:MAG: DUF1284 domain-containing protein [Suilimivivens sp.]
MSNYRIRAHHGMCLAFFEGKGYSSEFAKHMGEIKKLLSEDPVVTVVSQTDDICSFCPNNENGICTAQEKVAGYDRSVLSLCGLKPDTQMNFKKFEKLVNEKILAAGRRKGICGGCQWENICGKKEESLQT